MGSLSAIFAYILAHKEGAISAINTLINFYMATTAPVHTTVPAVAAKGDVPEQPAVVKKPAPEIMELQEFLNATVKPQPPLKIDGWVGTKTRDAIHKGVDILKPYTSMLGAS